MSRKVFAGEARDINPWTDLHERQRIAVATHKGIFVWDAGTYYNITPVEVSTSGSNIFSTSLGSINVLVSVSQHEKEVGDFVAFVSSATTIGGNIVIAALSTRFVYPIVSVPSDDSFYIEVPVTAAATSASTGGAIDVELLLHQGQKDHEFLAGWGTGLWGLGPWGSASTSTYATQPTTWCLDNWGQQLLANRRGGPVYVWANDVNEPMVEISAAPSIANYLLVSDEDRHLILFGTEDATSAYDPMFVRWSDQEDYTEWEVSITNSAGGKRLSGGGNQIIGARRSRGQILIWTDHDIYGMRFIGGNDVFGFDPLGVACGLISPHSHTEMGGITYWMSLDRFYYFDGTVNILSCDVLDFIFENLDIDNKIKVYSGINPTRNEVIWFYPDTSSADHSCNRYVTFNPIEKAWTIGSLDRALWSEDTVFNYPLAVGVSGEGIFYHELGRDAAGEPLEAYIDSAYFDIKEGDQILHVSRIVPDFSNFDQTGRNEGVVNITLRGRNFPNETPKLKGPYAVSAAVDKFDARLRKRQLSIRLESNGMGNEWRMGNIVAYVQDDGEH